MPFSAVVSPPPVVHPVDAPCAATVPLSVHSVVVPCAAASCPATVPSAIPLPYEERGTLSAKVTGNLRRPRFTGPQSAEQLRRNVQRNLDQLRDSLVTVPLRLLVLPPQHTARPDFGGVRILERLNRTERILLDIVVALVLLAALALLFYPVWCGGCAIRDL